MGSFSWIYCDMGEITDRKKIRKKQRMIIGHPGSVLFPEEFGGKDSQIDVTRYADYGRFFDRKTHKTIDIYELVADWNRRYLAEHPEHILPKRVGRNGSGRVDEFVWYPFYTDLSLTKEEVCKKWLEAMNAGKTGDDRCPRCWTEYRNIGINIACYNEDNASLKYPVKIARNPESVYEECPPSLNDPWQGFDISEG